jgi:ketol-acid reductoisomerase
MDLISGKGLALKANGVPNRNLVEVNDAIRKHSEEIVGRKLRAYMTAMKAVI